MKSSDKNKKPMAKFFLSTTNTWPNRFSCEDIAEGHSFKYFEADKNPIFMKEFLFFSVYAAEGFHAGFKIRFGFENPIFLNPKHAKKMAKAMNASNNIEGMSRFMLNEQISNMKVFFVRLKFFMKEQIIEKRRKKWKEIGAGNKVLINKNMEIFRPETQEKNRLEKKNRVETMILRVNSMKDLLEKKDIAHKRFLLEKPKLLKDGKEIIKETVNEHFKKMFKMKSWLKLVHILILVQIAKNFLDKAIKKKMHESYLSQIRRKTLLKLVAFTRMIGANANERLFIDSKFSVRYFLNLKRKKIRKRCTKICCEAIVQIAKIHEFFEKCETFRKHVNTIQKKWKTLQRKKVFFKFMVRNLWNQKFNEFYLDLKGIYSKNNDKTNKKSATIENVDTELQAKIINDFMIENLKRFRKEMDEYRDKWLNIRKDSKKVTQLFVLKHFAVDEQCSTPQQERSKSSQPFSFTFEASQSNKLIDDEPPLLYCRPSDYVLKKMIKIYLENKNLI